DAKICFYDDILPDGFSVRKGDMVSYQPYAMGRMKFIWGDDAEEFRPERWFDRDGKLQPQSPFKFTAFQVCFYTASNVQSFITIPESQSLSSRKFAVVLFRARGDDVLEQR
ncbi:Cytochrome P450, partial [Cucurbita argyrosperma subsp. argyrosperma]